SFTIKRGEKVALRASFKPLPDVAVKPWSKLTRETRNPFGVADVPDADGVHVQGFATTVKLAGDDTDANAKPWSENEPVSLNADSLDGEWASRWNSADARIPWTSG